MFDGFKEIIFCVIAYIIIHLIKNGVNSENAKIRLSFKVLLAALLIGIYVVLCNVTELNGRLAISILAVAGILLYVFYQSELKRVHNPECSKFKAYFLAGLLVVLLVLMMIFYLLVETNSQLRMIVPIGTLIYTIGPMIALYKKAHDVKSEMEDEMNA